MSLLSSARRSLSRHRRMTVLLLLLALLVLALCVSYTLFVLTRMRQETGQDLMRSTQRMASYVDAQIGRGQENMTLAAAACAALPDDQARLDYLVTLSGTNAAVETALFSRDGVLQFAGSGGFTPEKALLDQTLDSDAPLVAVFPHPTDQAPVLLYAAPLPTGDGAAEQGILWMDTHLTLERWLPASETLEAFLLHSDGQILLSVHEDLSGGSLFSYLGESAPLLGSSLEQTQAQLSDGTAGIYYYRQNGQDLALVYAPLAQSGWSLAFSLPTASLNETITLTLILGVSLALFLFLLFLVLVLLLRRTQRQHTRALSRLAFVDPLTGGHNATSFSLKAAKLLRSCQEPLALVSLDIRSFSLVNQAFGIQTGDKVLCHLYRCLTRTLSQEELCARIYVDRFDLLLRMDQPEQLQSRLTNLAQRFNEFNLALPDSYFLPLTVGICPVDDPTLPLEGLQDRANLARKEAKRCASDQPCVCRFYSLEDHRRLQMEQTIYNRMKRALADRHFHIYLQPKVSLCPQAVAGAEALVRWLDPEDGALRPDAFIPALERNGFIVQLDQYMFEQTCQWLRRWLDAGWNPPPVSVNLSQATLRRPQVLQRYQKIQRRWRVPPQLLELELTETMVSADLDYSARLVEEIHSLGFRCSLDDFGSGYSSLNVLSRLRVDTIKLDKRFFDGMLSQQDGPRSEQIVAAVLGLARQLGIKTVAEGVTCEHQTQFLINHPCDLVQGYYFSPPIPAEEFGRRFLSPQGRAAFSAAPENS